MAAQNTIVLENHVKLFVETKLGEQITLEFSDKTVYVRSCSKHGSTTLGAFWVRVLQLYFPKGIFTYKKHYSSAAASETLSVDVDEYNLTVYLRTGLLTIEGHLAHEWFKIVFRKVMDQYDRLTSANPTNYFKDQVVLDTRKEMKSNGGRRKLESHNDSEIYPDADLLTSDVKLDERNLRFLNDRRVSFEEEGQNEDCSVLIPVTPHSKMGTVTLQSGDRYIYPMWRQLLNKWFGIEGCQVYICTSHIDTDRLRDIANISYKNRLVMNLEALYTKAIPKNGQHMTQVKSSLLKGLPADEQLFIEYKIFNKIVYPITKSISCNFIAGLTNGVAELMMTSACFDHEGLAKENTMSSVTLTKMLEVDFYSNFIEQLATV